MKHRLTVSVNGPLAGGIVQCGTVSIRERLLRLLFGEQRKVTVIVPGACIEELAIQEVREDTKRESA